MMIDPILLHIEPYSVCLLLAALILSPARHSCRWPPPAPKSCSDCTHLADGIRETQEFCARHGTDDDEAFIERLTMKASECRKTTATGLHHVAPHRPLDRLCAGSPMSQARSLRRSHPSQSPSPQPRRRQQPQSMPRRLRRSGRLRRRPQRRPRSAGRSRRTTRQRARSGRSSTLRGGGRAARRRTQSSGLRSSALLRRRGSSGGSLRSCRWRRRRLGCCWPSGRSRRRSRRWRRRWRSQRSRRAVRQTPRLSSLSLCDCPARPRS